MADSLLPRILADLLILLAWSAWGAGVAWLLLDPGSPASILCVAFPLGAGLYSFSVFIASLAGLRLSASSLLVIYGLGWLALLGVGAILRRRRQPKPRRATPGLAPAIWALLGLLAVLACAVSVGRSYSQWDAAAGWSVKGYGIFLEGSVLAGERWGAWGLSYPLNIPLQIGAFAAFTQDLWPGSKLIFPAFYASMLLACADFWRRHGVPTAFIAAGVLLLGTMPLVFLHATIGYAGLPSAYYLVAGMMFGIDGVSRRDDGALILSGLLLGLAAWTRPESVTYSGLLIASIMMANLIARGRNIRWLPWLLPAAVIAGSWLLFSWTYLASSRYGKGAGEFVRQVLGGELNLFRLYLIPRLLLERMLDPRLWGLYFPVVALLAMAGLRPFRLRSFEVLATGLSALSLGLMASAIFYVRAYWVSDYMGLLTRSFDRAILPSVVALAVFLVLLFAPPLRGSAASMPTRADSSMSAAA